MKKDRVTTYGYRIQAQLLNIPTCKLLWLNTYLPTDPLWIHDYDDTELREVLLEVESILANSSYTDVIWAGDLPKSCGKGLMTYAVGMHCDAAIINGKLRIISAKCIILMAQDIVKNSLSGLIFQLC